MSEFIVATKDFITTFKASILMTALPPMNMMKLEK